MIKLILEDLDVKINKHIIYFINFINQINSKKISLSLINNIRIKKCKNDILQNISNISIKDANMVIITPYEKKSLNEIYNSIIKNNLINFNIIKLKDSIKVSISPMTQEKRKNVINYIKKELEIIKINIRNIRRDFNYKIKTLFINKKINQDIKIKSIKKIDEFIKFKIDYIEKTFINKEKDLLKI